MTGTVQENPCSGEFPPSQEAWSVDVPEADDAGADIYTSPLADEAAEASQSADQQVEVEQNEVLRPVEAWTDALFDDAAVDADLAEGSEEAELMPDPIAPWSVPGAPDNSEEE